MPTPQIRYEMTVTDPTITGGVSIRMTTVIIPPTYLQCTQYDIADDTFDALLTDAGRELFEEPDDVQQAISDAVAQSVSALVADHPIGICEDDWPCYLNDYDGSATENDADVTSKLWWYWGESPYEAPYNDLCGDPETDPSTLTSDSQLRRTLELSITAPRAPGVNLRPLIEYISEATLPAGMSSTAKDAISEALEDLLLENLVVTPTFNSIVLEFGDSYFSLELNDEFGFLTLVLIAQSDYGLNVRWGSATGEWTSNGTINSGATKSHEYGFDDTVPDQYNFTFTPSSISLTNEDNSDRTITPTLTFTNLAEPNTHKYLLNSTDDFESTGHLITSFEDADELIDPGYTPPCIYDATYVNSHPFLPFCENWFELNVAADYGDGPVYLHPPGKHPKCRIKIWPVAPPAGV